MISVKTLHELGYRITHAKNIALAAQTLRRVKMGAVNHDDLDRAIMALEHAPVSDSTKVVGGKENAEGSTDQIG